MVAYVFCRCKNTTEQFFSLIDLSFIPIGPTQRPPPDNKHHSQETSLGFEPTMSVGEGRQTYALDRADTRIDSYKHLHTSFKCCIKIRDWMLVIKKLINIEEEDVRRCVLNAAFNWASSFITPVSLHSKLWNVSMPTKISPLLSTWKSANSHVKVGITYSLY